jgi:hypothetical protein
MNDKTGTTITDDADSSQLHTADLVASGRPAPAAEDLAADGPTDVGERAAVSEGSSVSERATDRGNGVDQRDLGQTTQPAPTTGTNSGTVVEDTTPTALLGDVEGYRHRWEAVQTGFVDEPRRAVENADALVAEVMADLAKSFAQERGDLEAQWSQGDQVSTEDLRVSLRRYRSFFDRLLTT